MDVCKCDEPAMDVNVDSACRKCGLPVLFAVVAEIPTEDHPYVVPVSLSGLRYHLQTRHDVYETGELDWPAAMRLHHAAHGRPALSDETRCGIHGDSTSSGRCSTCDAALLVELCEQRVTAAALKWARAGGRIDAAIRLVPTSPDETFVDLEAAAEALREAEASVTS